MSEQFDPQIARLLARRRRARWALAAIVVVTVVLVAVDQFRFRGRDVAKFDRARFVLVRVDNGSDLIGRIEGRSEQITVRPMGLDIPPASTNLQARLAGKTVTLRLDPLRTRDADDVLLAYIYLGDGNLINLDVLSIGVGYADRRYRHPYSPQFEQVENEARKKERGLWKGLRFEDMPAWRQEWVKNLRDSAPR